MRGSVYGYLHGYSPADCCRLGSVLSYFVLQAEGCCTNAPTEQELTQAEQDKVRERINDIINEQLGDISEKTEAQLDKISNTKILELNEYADTVMNEINKNHNETVFLYDMLNEKAKEVKNTVKDVNNVKKEVDKAVSESAAAIENNTAEYAYTEEVKKEERVRL